MDRWPALEKLPISRRCVNTILPDFTFQCIDIDRRITLSATTTDENFKVSQSLSHSIVTRRLVMASQFEAQQLQQPTKSELAIAIKMKKNIA